MAKRTRAELKAENAELRRQVAELQGALVNALRYGQGTAPYQFPWQQPDWGTPPGGITIGDPPPGQGTQIWCSTPPNVSISLYQTAVSGLAPSETIEYFVGDPSEQHDQP